MVHPSAPGMHVVHHTHLPTVRGDGAQRLVAACRNLGVSAFEVWLVNLEPGAATPEQRHAGELVAVVQHGSGKLLVDGGPQRFQAPCTLLVPCDCVFQVANNGATPLQLVWVCTRAPEAADVAPPA